MKDNILDLLRSISDNGECTVVSYSAKPPQSAETFEHLSHLVTNFPFLSVYFHQAPQRIVESLTYRYGTTQDRFKDSTITFDITKVLGIDQAEWPTLKAELIAFVEIIKSWMDKDFNPWVKVQLATTQLQGRSVCEVDFLSENQTLATEATAALRAHVQARPTLQQFLTRHAAALRSRIGPHSWDTIATQDLYEPQVIHQWLHDHPEAR